jgi:hypothetical protein
VAAEADGSRPPLRTCRRTLNSRQPPRSGAVLSHSRPPKSPSLAATSAQTDVLSWSLAFDDWPKSLASADFPNVQMSSERTAGSANSTDRTLTAASESLTSAEGWSAAAGALPSLWLPVENHLEPAGDWVACLSCTKAAKVQKSEYTICKLNGQSLSGWSVYTQRTACLHTSSTCPKVVREGSCWLWHHMHASELDRRPPAK